MLAALFCLVAASRDILAAFKRAQVFGHIQASHSDDEFWDVLWEFRMDALKLRINNFLILSVPLYAEVHFIRKLVVSGMFDELVSNHVFLKSNHR